MSSAQSENSCQSSRGAPSNPQMIGIGYRRAMSATTSQRPVMVTASTSSVMTSMIVLCSRAVDRGVNAWETSRRNRWCSVPSRHSRPVVALSHSGPYVMPCAASTRPLGMQNRASRNTVRASS
jgi:hypothetical protein